MVDLAVSSLDLNGSIRELFRASKRIRSTDDARALIGIGTPLPGTLRSVLGQLEALPLESGASGGGIAFARVCEAASWVQAWAILGRLAVTTAESRDEDIRLALYDLADSSSSVFASLMRLYARNRSTSVSDEPLRDRLSREPQLILLLDPEFRIPWPDARPPGTSSPWYLPTAGDIVGLFDSEPKLRLGQLDIWGHINLQLDTWHEVFASSTGELAGATPAVALEVWLTQLATSSHFASGFTLDTRSPAAEASKRLEKVTSFLAFRRAFRAPASRATILTALAIARANADSPPAAIAGLCAAAEPLVANGEYLPAAAVWLRWAMLLSFQGEGISVARAKDNGLVPESLSSVWTRWRLPGPLQLPLDALAAAPGELRWHRAPPRAHTTRLVHDLFQASYRLLSGDWDTLEEEATRLGLAEEGTAQSGPFRRRRDRLMPARDALAQYFRRADASTVVLDDAVRAALKRTAAPDELSELSGGLALVSQLVEDRIRTAELLETVQGFVEGNHDSAAWGIALTGGDVDLSTLVGTVKALPNEHFDAYSKQLRDAIRALKTQQNLSLETQRLKTTFDDAEAAYNIALDRLLVARLGTQIAEVWRETAEKRARMAELDNELAELGQQIAKLGENIAQDNEQAKATKLALASRYASLAAAKLEALQALAPQLAEIIENSSAELDKLASQALAMADQIEAQRRRSFFVGLVKTLVTIVGAALAPFTGGLSAPIAAMVNQGIDLVNKLSQIPWDNLGAGLGGVLGAVQELAAAVPVDLAALGVPVPKALTQAQTFLRSTPVAEIPKLVSALKDLSRVDVTRLASAIASGFPLAVTSDNKLRLDGLDHVFDLHNVSAHVEEALAGVFAAGGFVKSELARSGEVLSRALEGPAAQLRQALGQELHDSFGLLDARTFGAMAQPASFGQQLARLKEVIADSAHVGDAAVRSLACALAKGALVVERSAGSIVLVAREAAEAQSSLGTRIDAYKARISSDEFGRAVDAVARHREAVENRMREILASSEDQKDTLLRNFAKAELPAKVTELRAALGALQRRVDDATDELQDKEDERRVCAFDASAARAESARAKLVDSGAALTLSRARIGLELADLDEQLGDLGNDRATRELEAEELAVHLAAQQLRRAYLACVASGQSPYHGSSTQPSESVTLLGVLSSSRVQLDETGKKVVPAEARKAAQAAAGMLSWLFFLELPFQGKQSRIAFYRTILEYGYTMNASAGDWKKLADDLDAAMAGRDDARFHFDLEEGNLLDLSSPAFLPWEQMGDTERQSWISLFSARARELIVKLTPLCVCRCSFYLPEAEPDRQTVAYYRPLLPREARLYVHTPGIVVEYATKAGPGVVPPVGSLIFLVAPPQHPRASPSVPTETPWRRDMIEEPIGEWTSAVDSPAQVSLRRQLQGSVFSTIPAKPGLLGALGDWTVLLLSNTPLTPGELSVLWQRVSLRLSFFVFAPLQ